MPWAGFLVTHGSKSSFTSIQVFRDPRRESCVRVCARTVQGMRVITELTGWSLRHEAT